MGSLSNKILRFSSYPPSFFPSFLSTFLSFFSVYVKNDWLERGQYIYLSVFLFCFVFIENQKLPVSVIIWLLTVIVQYT